MQIKFYTPKDIARILKISSVRLHTFRSHGLVVPEGAPATPGQTNWYSFTEVVKLAFIDELLKRGFSLATIKAVFSAYEYDWLTLSCFLWTDNDKIGGVSGRFSQMLYDTPDDRKKLADIMDIFLKNSPIDPMWQGRTITIINIERLRQQILEKTAA